MTLFVFAVVLIVSIPLGFIVTLITRYSFKPIQWLMNIYITIMRGTPLLLQVIFVYYGLPYIPVVGEYLKMDNVSAACVAFIIISYF